ncbi:hypothetical protein DKX38_010629 [Salix brachista]|uniref:peptidylprolyl isomerase n=1 Tax=Salix brachista TaxID=2182728 RepID=A0A5N5ME45_9ROSI|nr:hypothetical protein DKX38_010629 [Salix brachista]
MEKKMAKKKNPLVFMDMCIDGDPKERMVFELFSDIAPKTVENFRALCTGEKGIGPKSQRPLHYKGSFFHRIIKGSMAQDYRADGQDCISCDVGGDILKRDGTFGESIYGGKFPDESPKLKHDEPGLLSMSIADRDALGSQFIITFRSNHHLDRKYVVFGKLVQGNRVLKNIEDAGDEEGRPTVTVKIINCGEFIEDKKKVNKLKVEKHKKSSRDRKRRRNYLSDSESSSDSDMESTESDSDSDSLSSSSDISSSSEDRHKKRKRTSKRDKHRRWKKRDKRHEKRRKRRDKRSKHRSRRSSDSLTDAESESETSSDDDALDAQAKERKCRDPSQKTVEGQSPVVLEEEAASLPCKKREEPDILEKEDGEFPKENGSRRSNGIEADAKSYGSKDREPDIRDDHPGKSRSRSASRTHPQVSQRSISRSPAKSGSSRSPARSGSRSPVRAKKARSISTSPVRSQSPRSLSKSPVRAPPRRSRSRIPVGSHSRSLQKSISRRVSAEARLDRPEGASAEARLDLPGGASAEARLDHPGGALVEALAGLLQGEVLAEVQLGRQAGIIVAATQEAQALAYVGQGFLIEEVCQEVFPRMGLPSAPGGEEVSVNDMLMLGDTELPLQSVLLYSSYRRYSPRRYRTPPRSVIYFGDDSKERSSGSTLFILGCAFFYLANLISLFDTVSRHRGRRSRTRSPSLSRSPRYRNRHYSHHGSPVRSRSPVDVSKSHLSPRAARQRSLSSSRSPSKSQSSLDSHSPK